MSSDIIRVGLIGGGGIATFHINGYAQHPELIRVAAVADAFAATAEERGAELGVPCFTDYLEMLQQADIDAVDICLPHHLHRDAIVAAAKAGKHVLCEKPLCLSPDEAADVQRAVSESGITLMCAHNQLFMPAVAKAKELIDGGALGTVYEVRTTDSFRNEFDPSNMGWRAHASTSGGGELIDTGYHPSYLLMHLAGGVPVQATAMLSTHRLAFMEGEDSAQALFRFDNGAVGQLVTSWAYDPAAGIERFSVVGEHGSLTSDGTTLRWDLRDGTSESVTFDEVDTFAAEIGAFGACLRDGTRPIHSEREGIAVLGMILAAYEGARTGTIAPVLTADETVSA